MDKYEEWKQKNLEIFWLPAYSPQLNLIEILWKFIKYEWMEIEAYTNFKKYCYKSFSASPFPKFPRQSSVVNLNENGIINLKKT